MSKEGERKRIPVPIVHQPEWDALMERRRVLQLVVGVGVTVGNAALASAPALIASLAGEEAKKDQKNNK